MTLSRRNLILISLGALGLLLLLTLLSGGNDESGSRFSRTTQGIPIVFQPAEVGAVTVAIDGEIQEETATNQYILVGGVGNFSEITFTPESSFKPKTISVDDVTGVSRLEVDFMIDESSDESLVLESISANTPLDELLLDDGLWVKNIRYHGNNTWISGDLTTTKNATDGEFVVLQKNGERWDVVYAGTSDRASALRDASVPENIIQEIKGSS